MAGRRAGAGLALAAVALSAAGCGIGGSTKTVTVVRTHTVTTTRTVTETTATTAAAECTGSDLSGTFAAVPGGGGAGQIEYDLTLRNISEATCSISSPPNAVLLDAAGDALPTHVIGVYGSGPTIDLTAGSSAKAAARFSPDVPGTGDRQTGPCQPKASKLELTPAGSATTIVPIKPPTSVCEQGTLQFGPFSRG